MDTYEFKLINLPLSVKTCKMLIERKISFSEHCFLQTKGVHKYIVKHKGHKMENQLEGKIVQIKFGFVKNRNIHIICVRTNDNEIVHFILDDFTDKLDEFKLYIDNKYITIEDCTDYIPSALYSAPMISVYGRYVLDLIDNVGKLPFGDTLIDEKIKSLSEDRMTQSIIKKAVTMYQVYGTDKKRKDKLYEILHYLENTDVSQQNELYKLINSSITAVVMGWIDKNVRMHIQDVIQQILQLLYN